MGGGLEWGQGYKFQKTYAFAWFGKRSNKIIYVDDDYKMVLYTENFAHSRSGNDGGKYLGLKIWFDNITGCEPLVQELKELDEQYLAIYREKTL